jgi:hypothetical protein
MGVRTSFPIGKHWTAGVQVVNGWNNVSTTVNSGKTLGFVAALTTSKATWDINYYTGPANAGSNSGWLNLIDTTLLLTPTNPKWTKLNAYINYDYDRHGFGTSQGFAMPAVSWYGIAGALHEQLTGKFALAQRFEWFDDANGFDLSGALPPAVVGDSVPQQVKEITITAEYKLLEGLLWRLEYRRDWSTYPMFLRGAFPDTVDFCNYNFSDTCSNQEDGGGEGIVKAPDTGSGLLNTVNPLATAPGQEFPTVLPANNPAGLYGFSKSQNTITIGLIAFFGPKR